MTIAIIGAGAAGCICAAEAKRLHPEAEVTVFEAGAKPLAKVAVTGGGRCNLTNTFATVRSLQEVYPRGARLLQRLFHEFGPEDTRRWFEAEGVRLKEEDGGRIFPASDSAMTVVHALLDAMRRAGVRVRTRMTLETLECEGCGSADGGNCPPHWRLTFRDGTTASADAVVVTTGGLSGQVFGLPIEIVPPVPSLFTFNIPDRGLRELMGTTVRDARIKLSSTRMEADGDILVTHWGLSGPAVLRLSSYAARHLADAAYKAPVCVRWIPRGVSALQWLEETASSNPARLCSSVHPDNIPSRMWEYLLGRAGLRNDIRWGELGSKGAARLEAILTADEYRIEGQTRFREEFVTCGGVSLDAVNLATLEARDFPGLHFAGEVLDIDGITGGFNLQAAWTTGILAARHL